MSEGKEFHTLIELTKNELKKAYVIKSTRATCLLSNQVWIMTQSVLEGSLIVVG